jgi:hypothetical protein
MRKGFLWFCQNNTDTDYVRCSIELARSIKRHNKDNDICVVTDEQSRFESEYVDVVKVLKQDDSQGHDIKWANEHKAFRLTPFTHTIKLEADMLWTANTDSWWYLLWQHDLVFSVDCLNYKGETVRDRHYRRLFARNLLPNVYNGMTYFRKSTTAKRFFDTCEALTRNWQYVQKNILINCHDPFPSTDVVYALAYRLIDPTMEHLVDYPWFKFIHNKKAIHGLSHVNDHDEYLMPSKVGDKIYLGTQRLGRVWHYVDKKMMEVLDGRVF